VGVLLGWGCGDGDGRVGSFLVRLGLLVAQTEQEDEVTALTGVSWLGLGGIAIALITAAFNWLDERRSRSRRQTW
jgi:hypothetical protein